MNIGMILQTALAVTVIGASLFLALAATVFRKKWGHDIMGWHDCDCTGFDGASATGRCKYCGKECMMDGQGNWF